KLKADSTARDNHENVTIREIESTNPKIDVDLAKVYVASVSITDNNIESANIATLKLDGDNIVISTLSLANNNVVDGSLIKVSGEGRLGSDKLLISENEVNAILELDSATLEISDEGRIKDNTVESLIYTNTKSTISNLSVSGKKDNIITVATGAELSLTGDTNIFDNAITSGVAIKLYGALNVEGKVVIASNSEAGDASILIYRDGIIKNVDGKRIATSSKINVDVVDNNKTVFRYWNEYSLDEFKNAKTMNDPSKIFEITSNSKSLGRVIYKKGTYSDVELVLGDDYRTLTFKVSDVIIATQYVARNVSTYVDPVIIEGKDISKQIWIAPSSDDETKKVEWTFAKGNYSVKLTSDNSFIYKVHKHKICGLPSTESCAHFDGITHADVEWEEITSMQDFIDNSRLPDAKKQHYFVLATNCEITEDLDRYLTTGDAICLNGYKLTFVKGFAMTLATGRVENLTITDCAGNEAKGAITTKVGTDEGSSDYHFLVRSGELRLYNVNIEGFTVDSLDGNTKMMDIRRDGKVVFDGVTFRNNTYDNADSSTTWMKINNLADVTFYNTAFTNNKVYNSGDPDAITSIININGNTNTKYASISFIGNEVPLAVLSVDRNTISIGTVSFIGNTINGMNGDAGAVLTVDNVRLTIDGKSRFENNTGSAVKLTGRNARLESAYDMFVKGNTANYGSAFNVENKAILVITDKMKLVENIATYGTIYAKDASIVVDPTLATFSMARNKGNEGAGIYLDRAELNATNELTLLGNDGPILVIDNTSSGVYRATISKLIIDGAYGNKDGVAIKVKANDITLSDIKVRNANATASIIAVYGKNTVIEKSDIRDNRSTNSTIVVDDENASLKIYDETSITNNTNGATGALYIKRGTVSIGDRIKINDNLAFTGYARNVFVTSNGTMFVDATHKLSTRSDISVSVQNKELAVLKYWNEDNIVGFDKAPVFVPEDVISLDEEYDGTSTRLYKSGKYKDVSVKLGDEYASIT
ncbi:MAG: hypothetical protein IJ593_05470, partial [Lachnospiraceae bacterium]|nr:hypothetical protein [Lachnospiraceae bacterium]